jgi:hypothetical protein
MTGWSVERAHVRDAPEIARLLARVVPERFLDLTIWGSPLFYRYCEDSLRSQDAATPRFYVLRLHQSVGGAVSLRRIEDRIVIDTAYALPALRASYLSLRLLYEASQREFERRPADLVAWDVFSGRPRLEAWHRSLGGREEFRKGWWLRGPDAPEIASGSTASVMGLAAAEEQHARWGFSSFEVRTSAGAYRVGRLPGRSFRLTDAHAADDPALFAALQKVDAGSRVLLMGPVERPGPSWAEVTTLKRYQAPFATFSAALEQYFRSP